MEEGLLIQRIRVPELSRDSGAVSLIFWGVAGPAELWFCALIKSTHLKTVNLPNSHIRQYEKYS